MKELSDWQLSQWCRVESLRVYNVSCRLCDWCDGTGSKGEALELFRDHWKAHQELERTPGVAAVSRTQLGRETNSRTPQPSRKRG